MYYEIKIINNGIHYLIGFIHVVAVALACV